MVDIKFEVILKILFLKISNTDILFDKETFMWKSYTTNKALFIIEQVQIVDLKEYVIAALDTHSKTFVIHVAI